MKKIILIVLCLLLINGCTFKERDTILIGEDSIKFVDDKGYTLTLYYDSNVLENVEWRIPTDSIEKVEKLYNHYKDDTDFSARIENNTLVLDYSEKYIDEVFGTVKKEDIKNYLKGLGYALTTEEGNN